MIICKGIQPRQICSHNFFFVHLLRIPLNMPHHGFNMSGAGSFKDDSLRPPTSSNALTDNLLSMRFQPPLHLRGSPTVRSLLPRRTPQEQNEFLASILSEAMSIADDAYDYDFDNGIADDDSNKGASSNSNSHEERKQ
jgi:hypothetical protein